MLIHHSNPRFELFVLNLFLFLRFFQLQLFLGDHALKLLDQLVLQVDFPFCVGDLLIQSLNLAFNGGLVPVDALQLLLKLLFFRSRFFQLLLQGADFRLRRRGGVCTKKQVGYQPKQHKKGQQAGDSSRPDANQLSLLR